jgi:hypothetical protein
MKVVRVPMREDEAYLEPVVDEFFAPQLRHSDTGGDSEVMRAVSDAYHQTKRG